MAPLPYSASFFRAPGFFGGPTRVYVVEPNFRAVIKCITVVWGDISGSGLDVWLQDAAGCKFVRQTWGTTGTDIINLGGTQLFFGSWVMETGEELFAQCPAGQCDLQASGYRLSMV